MTDQEKQAELVRLIEAAHAALAEAEAFANEHELTFAFTVAYGMGGYYDGEDGEWTSSSQNC